jgi:hypothetical protein
MEFRQPQDTEPNPELPQYEAANHQSWQSFRVESVKYIAVNDSKESFIDAVSTANGAEISQST